VLKLRKLENFVVAKRNLGFSDLVRVNYGDACLARLRLLGYRFMIL